ncbi:hypothetical protein [Kitasatospora phosalacinea]|uniref:Uncharacterized protein n=1 Tax=Kitasatospora phosalacinea TaxID=2065 RepID=A0ABW6GPT1_9ACTN
MSFEDEAGQSMTPPRARTWGRKGEPKGFGRCDFRDLGVRARIQLGGPVVLVWDDARIHLVGGCLAGTGLIMGG